MYPKVYQLIERCISDGIANGIYNYNKHVDQPLTIPDDLQHHILSSSMLELSEWFSFTDEDLGVVDQC
jgi:hypothetical protein